MRGRQRDMPGLVVQAVDVGVEVSVVVLPGGRGSRPGARCILRGTLR